MKKRSMLLLWAAVLSAVLMVATTASADPPQRKHCQTATISDGFWLFYSPSIYKNTIVDFVTLPAGTKVRVDARAEGYDWWPPDPHPVGTMYRVSRIVGTSTGMPQPGQFWLIAAGNLAITPQFERCAAGLPVRG